LTIDIKALIFIYRFWGCPGFDGIGKSCIAGEGEGPLNWQKK